MKRKNLILVLSILASLTGCSYFEGFFSSFINSGYGTLSQHHITSSSSSSTTVTPYENESPLHEVLSKDEDFQVALPTTGDVKVLVIPVEIGSSTFSTEDLDKINLAFNGTSEETGYESVSSYYYKTSKGKLKIEAEISPVFQTGKSKGYYEVLYNNGKDVDCEILDNALPLLDELYDFSQFDYNKDSYIDGIYLIYSCDYSLSETSPFWAWCYEHTKNTNKYDNVEPRYFVWASKDFLYDPVNERKKINVNAETIIHETGHLFGLDDYYDYDTSAGPDGGLGGAAMMDSNVGDQDSFSKLLLGWSNPTYIYGEGTYTISPSESSNECLIIPLRNNENEVFGEYLLIDYYTPTGLNEMQAGNFGLFSKKGVRIYHIDARIDSNLGSPKNLNGYYSIFSFNNSDTQHKLIRMLEADNNKSIERTGIASNYDLFTPGHSLSTIYNYDDVMYENIITIVSVGDYATIKITKKEEK